MSAVDNPFFAPSDLPHGVPAFDRATDEHYLPAIEYGMAQQRAEIAAIVADPAEPTFANTLEALERSGRLLAAVEMAFETVALAHASERLQEIKAQVAPLQAAHHDAIYLDSALFARIDALHQQRAALNLDAEADWLLHRYHTEFVRSGAQLAPADAELLKALNMELAGLENEFSQRRLADNNKLAVLVTDPAELAGLTPDVIAAAAEAAEAAGHPGQHLITLVSNTDQPVLGSLHSRELRERIYRASSERCAHGDDNDTRDIILRTVRLRAQRAQLLGFPTHAAYQVQDNTAGTPEAVSGLLDKLVPAAVANAQRELADLQALADTDSAGITIEPWDWSYYTERLRQQRFSLDEAQLRPYFEAERVLVDGVFHAARELFGLTVTERHDLPVYHPDVRTFDVFNADGSLLGLFYLDLYARPSKVGGAWMHSLVIQSHLLGSRPVVVNTHNVPRPPDGEPTLLTLSEVRTMFHEFGHALHGLFSDVVYPRFYGTAVPQDFVEYPSQVNEVWMYWPSVLAQYARHHRTGEPLAQSVVDSLLAAEKFNAGFTTTEYLAAAVLDLAWHSMPPEHGVTDVVAFEAAALAEAGFRVAAIPPRYRSTYFSHIFASTAYSANYYVYIWSEVLDADTVDWFRENGGLLRANGDRFRAAVLSRGGTAEAMSYFRDLRGRESSIEPLLVRRGLTAP